MASIFARKDTNALGFNFRVKGHRFREQTALKDTPANRKRLRAILDKIEAELTLGIFDYKRHFPSSQNIPTFNRLMQGRGENTPPFSVFANRWLAQMAVQWRPSYAKIVRQNLKQALLPAFGKTAVDRITRDQIFQFRCKRSM